MFVSTKKRNEERTKKLTYGPRDLVEVSWFLFRPSLSSLPLVLCCWSLTPCRSLVVRGRHVVGPFPCFRPLLLSRRRSSLASSSRSPVPRSHRSLVSPVVAAPRPVVPLVRSPPAVISLLSTLRAGAGSSGAGWWVIIDYPASPRGGVCYTSLPAPSRIIWSQVLLKNSRPVWCGWCCWAVVGEKEVKIS